MVKVGHFQTFDYQLKLQSKANLLNGNGCAGFIAQEGCSVSCRPGLYDGIAKGKKQIEPYSQKDGRQHQKEAENESHLFDTFARLSLISYVHSGH